MLSLEGKLLIEWLMLMFVHLISLAEEKCCKEIVMFMFLYPVSCTLRPVRDCKLISCVDLHTCSRSIFEYSYNFEFYPVCLFILVVFLIQLLVKFVYTLNTNHHRTTIPRIPTAQTIAGDVMCEFSDDHLVFLPTC